jgi:hypothetical protein
MCVIQTGMLSSSFSPLIASNEALLADPGAAADGGRGPGFSELTGSRRGRRC